MATGRVQSFPVDKRLASMLLLIAFALLFPDRTAGQKDARDITFDDVKFDMKKGDRFKDAMIHEEIREMIGEKIRIRGFILPGNKETLKGFIFVRDNQECCFGPGAMLYDCMIVRMAKGAEIKYTVKPITIEGKFSVKKVVGPDDQVLAVFHVRGARKK